MRILVVGAGGFLGRPICSALRANGHDVVAGLRDPAASALLPDCSGALRVDFAASGHLPAARELAGFDAVVNAAGIFAETRRNTFEAIHSEGPVRLFRLCAAAGVRRIVQISALGAGPDAATEYHRSKAAADVALQQMALERVVLRPSLVIGGEGASWRLFKALSLLPFAPARADKILLQPVALEDVVRAVAAAVETTDAAGHVIDLVAPQPLSLRAYLDRLAAALGQPRRRRLPVSWRLLHLLAWVSFLKPGVPFSGEALVMLAESRECYSAEPCRQLLGFVPQNVDTYLLQHPPGRAERLAARLYAAGPLLRLSLAAMWLWSGLVSLGLYPVADSLVLLRATGIEAAFALPVLFAAASLDMLLGLWTLLTRRPALVAEVQLALVCTYSVILSVSMPELWLHPFGPLLKNIPVIAAIVVWRILEEDA